MFTIALGHLLERGVCFQRDEALAIAQELIARRDGVPTVDNVQVSSDGSVTCIVANGTPQVSDVAALLQVLLPTTPGQVPAPLRYTLARGLAAVEAPAFESLDAFSESLARFESGDRHGIIRALLQRVADAPPPRPRRLAVSTAAVPAVVAPRTPPPQPSRAAVSGAQTPAPALDRAPAPALAQELFVSSSRSAPSPPINWGVALLAIAASFVLGALGGQWAGLWQRPATTDARPTAAQPSAARPPAETVAPNSGVVERPVSTTGSAPAALDTDAAALPSPQPTEKPAPREDVAIGAPVPIATPVPMIHGNSEPAFSPAFVNTGSAMFFHTGGAGDPSSAIAMTPDAAGWPAGDLRIVKVLDDGARNYHPRPSPDGRLIAFDSDRDGVRGVYVANADGTGVRRISPDGYSAAPTWSPDGKRLAYIRAERGNARVWNLWVHAIADRLPTRVTEYAYGQTWSASWFPDARRICFTHEDKVIVRDLSTGELRQFASPVAGRIVRTPAVSPDGTKVVFQVFRNGGWLLDLADGSMRRVLSDPTAEEFAWAPDGNRIAFHSRRTGEWSIYVVTPG